MIQMDSIYSNPILSISGNLHRQHRIPGLILTGPMPAITTLLNQTRVVAYELLQPIQILVEFVVRYTPIQSSFNPRLSLTLTLILSVVMIS